MNWGRNHHQVRRQRYSVPPHAPRMGAVDCMASWNRPVGLLIVITLVISCGRLCFELRRLPLSCLIFCPLPKNKVSILVEDRG
jgi:hypothetical protein